jgi:MbtH protein
MSWEDREDNTIYKVVVNHEEQYSIWPAHRENPLGWNDVGKSGPKDECLAYIKEVWTDMRPLSLRKKMEEMEKNKQAGVAPALAGRRLPLTRSTSTDLARERSATRS